MLNYELIYPIGKAPHAERALITGRQNILVLIRFAGDLDGRFHAKAGGIGDYQPQFASVALSKCPATKHEDEKQNNTPKSVHELSSPSEQRPLDRRSARSERFGYVRIFPAACVCSGFISCSGTRRALSEHAAKKAEQNVLEWNVIK